MSVGGAGQERAFRSLYDRTHRQVLAYCLRRCRDRADALDAAADAYVVAWRRFGDLPDGPAALLWLFATARRVIANQRRSSQRQQRLRSRLRTLTVSEPSLEDLVASDEERQNVLSALDRLSEDDQELLRLTEFEQLPHADVASLLGISANAVGVRLHRARRRLAAEYERVHGRRRGTTATGGDVDG